MNNCPNCKEPAIVRYGELTTLVGYSRFTDDNGKEHHHDDNCLKQNFACSNDHVWQLSEQRRCEIEGCVWIGKDSCFCHVGKKVDSFCNDDIPLVLDHDRMYPGEWKITSTKRTSDFNKGTSSTTVTDEFYGEE